MAIDRGAAFHDAERDPRWSPDGFGNIVRGGEYYGNNAYDDDVDRDRAIGAAAQGTAPVTVDQAQANEARGLQMGGLGLLRAQADGSAPSSAAILSQRVNQDAIRQAAMHTTGAKSAAGGIVANRAGGEAAGSAMLAGNAQNADRRAAEIAKGQTGFAAGAGTVNAQDIGVATSDAQLAAQQRALDEQRQQFFERQAHDTRAVQQQAMTDSMRQAHEKAAADRAFREAKTADDFNKAKDVVNIFTSLGQSASRANGAGEGPTRDPNDPNHTGSDERMKSNVVPMGSLSHLMRGRR